MIKHAPTDFLFLDIETAGFSTEIRLINAFHVKRIKPNGHSQNRAYRWVEQGHLTGVCIEQFLDSVSDAGIHNARVYGHNVGFDVRYFLHEMKSVGIKYVASFNMNCSVLLAGKLYVPEYKLLLEFRDSMRLAPMGLDKFAQSFCPEFPKLPSPDFANCSTDELIPYCRRDCEIVYRGLQTFSSEMGTKLERLPLTIPSLAFAKLRKLGDTLHGVQRNSGLHREYNDILRDYYFGGRIYIAEGVKIDSHYDVVSLDITSSYPAQMLRYKYPKNEAPNIYNKPKSLPTDGRYFAQIKIYGYTPALPIIPYRQPTGGVTYPRGTFEAFLSDIELQFIIEKQTGQYEKIDILQVIHWRDDQCAYWLRDFVEVYYKIKLRGDEMNSRESGSGELYRTIGKLLLNSAYGKFAEKYHAGDDGVIYHANDCEDVETVDFESETEETTDRRNVAIAALITASGRVQLAEMIDYYGARNVIYCDTDSVKIIKSVFESTPKHPLINNDLGGWKNEGEYHGFTVIAPKLYYGLHNGKPELKAKGMRTTKTGSIKFAKLVFSGDDLIKNDYSAITTALSIGAIVKAYFEPMPTQIRTFLKSGQLAEEQFRSFTHPNNVTGFDYDIKTGYSFKQF